MGREILLNAFDMNCVGHQSCGLWRHPRDRSTEYTSMAYWLELARTLERGLFDAIFFADVTGVYDVYEGKPDAALRSAAQVPANDPFTLVPLMASVTEHLSFGVTGAIPYEPPYAFARRISSLDHLTDGRIAWNIVTGYLDSAARGTGRQQQVAHNTRYEIAAEYMQVVYPLWESSWEDGAVLRDRARGVFADPTKVHRIVHRGEFFQVDAIHLCEPSTQRTPVLFQAGTSPKGQAFAAQHAECVFVPNGDPATLAETVTALREQAVRAGRSGDDLKIFAMLCIVVDESDAAARARFEDYQSYGQLEGALALMSGWSGSDLSLTTAEGAGPSEAVHAAREIVQGGAARELAKGLTVGGAAPVLVGSASTVADALEQQVERTGVDGFNLAYTVMPESVEALVDLLVPELQRRGVYKTHYAQGTLREKLFGAGPRLRAPHPAVQFRHATPVAPA